MKNHAAPHKQALRRRVKRFFRSSTQLRTDVYDFVDVLTKNNHFDVYVFGGLVRDIGLFGVRDFTSDVDLVVETQRASLQKALSQLPKHTVTANKFGGFRIKQGSWSFDIWCAKDTWAIKNQFVKYEDISSLLKTTFLSWDSALFDVKNQKLICGDDYLENLGNGRLDIVLQHSPNELGSMVRLTRAIYSKGAKELQKNALNTLKTLFAKYSSDEIVTYEDKSYTTKFLSIQILDELKKEVDALPNGSLLKIEHNKQLILPFEHISTISDCYSSFSETNINSLRNKLSLSTRLDSIQKNDQLSFWSTDH